MRSVSPKTWSEGSDKGLCRMDSLKPRPRGQKPDTRMINRGKGKRESPAWPSAHTWAASAAPWLKPRIPSKGPSLVSACATVPRASSRPLHTAGSFSAEKTSVSCSENHQPRGCSSGRQGPGNQQCLREQGASPSRLCSCNPRKPCLARDAWTPGPSPAPAGRGHGRSGPVRGSRSTAPVSCRRRSPWGRAAARKCPVGPPPPHRVSAVA